MFVSFFCRYVVPKQKCVNSTRSRNPLSSAEFSARSFFFSNSALSAQRFTTQVQSKFVVEENGNFYFVPLFFTFRFFLFNFTYSSSTPKCKQNQIQLHPYTYIAWSRNLWCAYINNPFINSSWFISCGLRFAVLRLGDVLLQASMRVMDFGWIHVWRGDFLSKCAGYVVVRRHFQSISISGYFIICESVIGEDRIGQRAELPGFDRDWDKKIFGNAH